jgi:hypothetical protein
VEGQVEGLLPTIIHSSAITYTNGGRMEGENKKSVYIRDAKTHPSHTDKKKSVCSSLNPLTSGRTPQNGVLFV